VASAIAAGVALVLTVSAMGGEAAPAADAEQRATERAEACAEGRAAEEHLGPVYVRSFKPMRTSPIRLWERHGPVYFRSPFAEPTASDRDVDRCIPLAAGAAVADWAIFAARVLGFPVELAIAPPWQTEPLGR
jgi:hypothetical protein